MSAHVMPAHTMTEARRAPVLQTLTALAVGAYLSDTGLVPFQLLAGGDTLRGVLLLVVLVVGGALALWAPYRLRGWRAVLAGGLVLAAVLVARHLLHVTAAPSVRLGLQVLAVGFAIGGVVAAAGAAELRERALVTGGLAGGLVFGLQLYVLPLVIATSDFGVDLVGGWFVWVMLVVQYLGPALALLGAALAVLRVAPSGPVNLTAAPLVFLVTVVLVVLAVAGGLRWLVLAWLLVPLAAGAAAWWLTPAALTRSQS